MGSALRLPAGTVLTADGVDFRPEYPIEITNNRVTIRVPIEEYVSQVLAGESSTFTSIEALKAMAVTARTYAVRFIGRHKAEGFDFCDTTHCQDFRMKGAADRLRQAAETTAGELVWYAGSPAATYYGQNCGGRTEAAAEGPYLRVQDDNGCPRLEWMAKVDGQIQVTSRTASDRARMLLVNGVAIPADRYRLNIGRRLGWNLVRSDLYRVQGAVVEGRGAGHGIGLCQAGAEQRGLAGASYRDILAFYYPGTGVGVTARGLSWTRSGGERVDLFSTQPDMRVLAAADSAARFAEERTGLLFSIRPKVHLYPTVASFRDATGEPGWVAASTRGSTIRLQPAGIGALRHEMIHVLVDRNGLPLWFREGLTLYLTSPTRAGGQAPPLDSEFDGAKTPAEMKRFYGRSASAVAALAARYGEHEVLSWLARGIPAGAIPGGRPGAARK